MIYSYITVLKLLCVCGLLFHFHRNRHFQMKTWVEETSWQRDTIYWKSLSLALTLSHPEKSEKLSCHLDAQQKQSTQDRRTQLRHSIISSRSMKHVYIWKTQKKKHNLKHTVGDTFKECFAFQTTAVPLMLVCWLSLKKLGDTAIQK